MEAVLPNEQHRRRLGNQRCGGRQGCKNLVEFPLILAFGHRDDPDRRFSGGPGRVDLRVDLGGVPQNKGAGGNGDLVDRTEDAAEI